jgi:hypothetical protein
MLKAEGYPYYCNAKQQSEEGMGKRYPYPAAEKP